MKIKPLMITLSLSLFFLITHHASRAQKDGAAQSVSFDENNWPTLKFSNKRADKQHCGAFVSYVLAENQEEALAIRVTHMHSRRVFQGMISFPEEGWLYITASRIIFVVAEGDKSHAFNAPRTALKDKPVTEFVRTVAGVQINFKQSPSASDTKDQKFAFLVLGDGKCQLNDPEPYTKLLARAVKDFDGAMAEFQQMTASLKQSGRIQQAPASAKPPRGFAPKVP